MNPERARATESTLQEFWDALGLSAPEQERERFNRRRFLPLLDFADASPPTAGQVVLDIGAGLGNLLVAMHARYGGEYHYADVDVPPPERQALLRQWGVSRFFSVRLDRPEALAELPADYDWIVLTEVLEHLLVNPLVLFRAFSEHLKPGGRLLITTPNQARARNRVNLLVGRSIKERDRYPTDGSPRYGHVMEYTVGELRELLGNEGFRVVRSTVIQNVPFIRASRTQRAFVPLMNSKLASNLQLGDDILLLAAKGLPR